MNGCLLTDIYTHRLPEFYKKGDNLCFYDYIYYLLSQEFKIFVSEPYIHPVSKQRIFTISKLFTFGSGEKNILCIDFFI